MRSPKNIYRPHHLAVRILDFHSNHKGSNPFGVTKNKNLLHRSAVDQLPVKENVVGSNPTEAAIIVL